MIVVDGSLFLMATFFLIVWMFLLFRFKLQKSIYTLYFFMNMTVFYGPLLYYYLGFTAYTNALSSYSLEIYSYITVFVFVLNIVVLLFTQSKRNLIHWKFFNQIVFAKIRNHSLVSNFYIIAILISLGYVIIFHRNFPLVALFKTGELGDRLDSSGAIPFYIAFSSFFLVLMPSAFFYFRSRKKNSIWVFMLFLFTLFCLTAGGNKGLVSFFLLFYVLIASKNQNVLKYVGLLAIVLVIYAVLKGVTTLDEDTGYYLMESPFRRLFAAQGAGYIARIELIDRLILDGSIPIKHQIYNYIYMGELGSGSSPTHFTGDLFVKYGYLVTALIFICFTIYYTKIMISANYIYTSVDDAFVLWNFFIVGFLLINSEINTANLLRIFLVIGNLIMVNYAARIRK